MALDATDALLLLFFFKEETECLPSTNLVYDNVVSCQIPGARLDKRQPLPRERSELGPEHPLGLITGKAQVPGRRSSSVFSPAPDTVPASRSPVTPSRWVLLTGRNGGRIRRDPGGSRCSVAGAEPHREPRDCGRRGSFLRSGSTFAKPRGLFLKLRVGQTRGLARTEAQGV